MATAPKPAPRRLARAADALKPFQLVGVRDTGEKIGDGSYATVKKLELHGLKCAGKKIHAHLYELANQEEKMEMLRSFVRECELLSRLHHPCIVQFLGVYFEEGSQLPVMVMEYLYATLAECLHKYGVLPEEITYGILRDVALGLCYLHEQSPPIIHRDLSANNVLLATDMSAKISDLGVAKILNLKPGQITQRITTQAPGTPCYMPPEALVAKPSYTSKIDSYSYGVLMIHILCGKWPLQGDPFTEAPNSPGSFLPVSEFDRRREHILKIGLGHPLMGLIRQCLSNAPATRPEVSEILGRIEDLKSSLPASFENKVEMIHQIQSRGDVDDTDGQKSPYIRPTHDESQLRWTVETLRRESEAHQSEIESKTREIQLLRQHSESQKGEISSLRKQLAKLSLSLPSPSTVDLHTPVKWKRCTDLPVAMKQHRSVLLKGNVYVGGGYTRSDGGSLSHFLVFQYDCSEDAWVTLPPCPVRLFSLSQFQGHLIAVGGCTDQGVASSKVYRYREKSQEWKKYLKPMPTARYSVSVITTPSTIIACAGVVGFEGYVATVEAYIAETGRWHTVDSLPSPCGDLRSVVIDDSCYLLGGHDQSDYSNRLVFQAQVSSLIESAFPPSGKSAATGTKSAWKTIRDTPKHYCTATSIDGRLLAVGGRGTFKDSAALFMFVPAESAWTRMPSGSLPMKVYSPAAIELPGMELLVCGGVTNNEASKATYIGSFVE